MRDGRRGGCSPVGKLQGCGDERDGVRLAFPDAWRGAVASRLGEDGEPVPCGRTEAVWTVPFALGQMCPEFIILEEK